MHRRSLIAAGAAIALFGNTGLGTGASGCVPLYCGSAGNMGNALAIAGGDPPYPTLGLFGHPERIKDFGYRAMHVMTLRGKEIVDAFYQQSAKKSYFIGRSTGGPNALTPERLCDAWPLRSERSVVSDQQGGACAGRRSGWRGKDLSIPDRSARLSFRSRW
jgi:Tannase and feruloyl esterase